MEMTEKYYFTKMHGAGNDFIIIDKDTFPDFPNDPRFIAGLCKRRFGIGADGLITIAKDEELDFVMEYYNADGMPGSLCGNGARCALRYAYREGKTKGKEINFSVADANYRGKIIDENLVEFALNEPSDYDPDVVVSLPFGIIKGKFINTGSPHFVVHIDDEVNTWAMKRLDNKTIESFPVESIGSAIRHANTFAPEGTNVNFFQIRDNVVHIRTYERGVEAETSACGTGSVAAAIIAVKHNNLSTPVNLRTRGNDTLTVDFNDNGETAVDITLIGPAIETCRGEFFLDTYKSLE